MESVFRTIRSLILNTKQAIESVCTSGLLCNEFTRPSEKRIGRSLFFVLAIRSPLHTTGIVRPHAANTCCVSDIGFEGEEPIVREVRERAMQAQWAKPWISLLANEPAGI